jgi:CRISPR/Cas system-associated protein endoribonuclease Cas2
MVKLDLSDRNLDEILKRYPSNSELSAKLLDSKDYDSIAYLVGKLREQKSNSQRAVVGKREKTW